MLIQVGVVVLSVLLVSACGSSAKDVVTTTAAPATAPRGEPILIRDKVKIAANEGSEPIATGTILAGSTLGSKPFCPAGTIRDSHASLDPEMKEYLIDRKISCPDGTVRIGLTPKVGADFQSPTQKGSWTIVSGTGAYEGLGGSGKSKTVYGTNPNSPVRETFAGTATR